MSTLVWDKSAERLYETGVSHGVLFPKTGSNGAYATGVVWNGLTSVSENPTGAEANAIYADNIKYLNLMSTEEFEGTIEAYTYPDEFAVCDGTAALGTGVYVTAQPRKEFALSYQTKIGNADDNELGYKLHIVYGALASPSEKSYETVNDSPEAMTFSWDFTTTPVEVTGFKPTSHVIIDSTKVPEAKMTAILAKLYGSETPSASSTLLMPDEIKAILDAN